MKKDDFTFRVRPVRAGEGDVAEEIELACFPPNEACKLPIMRERVRLASDLFWIAEDEAGKPIGFLASIATEEEVLRDEFFTETTLHDPKGANIMVLSVAVLPEYRRLGVASAMMTAMMDDQRDKGRRNVVLTCLESRIPIYESMGFIDRGESASEWGGDSWHEMYQAIG